MLTLLPDSVNEFAIRIYDANQLLVDVSVPPIVIVRGKYSIYGQPLPSDICIEVDDNATNTTYLEVIFEKNEILPLRKTITKTLSRTIVKGTDDQLVINVLEGSRYATAQTNLPIGVIAIKGTSIERDLIKGSDVDLTIEISENRDITISAWVSITDTEYKEVFSPSVRSVNIDRLKDETDYLVRVGRRNLEQAIETEDFEGSSRIQDAIDALQRIAKRLMNLSGDDVTDEKYKLDEQKRKLAATIDTVSKDTRLRQLQEDYFEWKSHTQSILSAHGSEALNVRFKNLVRDEAEFLKGSEAIIRRKIDDMRQLTWDIRKHDPQYVAGLYLHYALKDPVEYTDEEMAQQLITRGDAALERGNMAELLEVIYRLYDLLIDKDEDETMKGTGLA
jgi:molecular chaperone DnaK